MNVLNQKVIIGIAVAVLVVVVSGGGFFLYQKTQAQKSQNSTTDQKTAEETKKLVAEVGKLIELPTGEDPTVATVTDITKLKDQPFFQKAKNGDKVLIYTNAKKAILYNPETHKVIDVAPLNIGTQSAQTTQPKISLKNGTAIIGLTTKVETELKKTISNINVIEKENASKNDYEKTIIVILNPDSKDYAANLVNLLKGSSIGDLPSGEIKPKDGDILVILGKDRS